MRLAVPQYLLTLALFQFTHPGKGATAVTFSTLACISCFNSRTLGRVRLIVCTSLRPMKRFQFTHPGKGATSTSQRGHYTAGCFNSRTLGRVRPALSSYFGYDLDVSIHAPWEGCDRMILQILLQTHMFQFTHPGKGATGLDLKWGY